MATTSASTVIPAHARCGTHHAMAVHEREGGAAVPDDRSDDADVQVETWVDDGVKQVAAVHHLCTGGTDQSRMHRCLMRENKNLVQTACRVQELSIVRSFGGTSDG